MFTPAPRCIFSPALTTIFVKLDSFEEQLFGAYTLNSAKHIPFDWVGP